MVICAPTYCGTVDIAYLGGDIKYQQLGFATAATYYNWIYGTLICKAQDVVDNYAGHNFKSNDGTITLDGGGKEAIHINRIGLVDGSPPTLLPVPLLDITSVVIDSAASVHAACQAYDAYLTYDRNLFCYGKQNVVIKATWGYVSVPHDIQYVTAQICINFLKEAIRTRMMPDLIAASLTGQQPVSGSGISAILSSPKILTKNERDIIDRYRYREVELI